MQARQDDCITFNPHNSTWFWSDFHEQKFYLTLISGDDVPNFVRLLIKSLLIVLKRNFYSRAHRKNWRVFSKRFQLKEMIFIKVSDLFNNRTTKRISLTLTKNLVSLVDDRWRNFLRIPRQNKIELITSISRQNCRIFHMHSAYHNSPAKSWLLSIASTAWCHWYFYSR